MSPHPQELLSAFLDAELAPAERTQVEEHLRVCALCAQELSELALVDRMGRELEVTAPEGYFEALPARLRPRLRVSRPARRAIVPPWVLAAAALVLVGVLIPITWQRQRSAAPEATAKRSVVLAPPAVLDLPSPQATDNTLPQTAAAGRQPLREAVPATVAPPNSTRQDFAPPPRPQPTTEPSAVRDELKSLGYVDAPPRKAPLDKQASAPIAAADTRAREAEPAGGSVPAPAVAGPGNGAASRIVGAPAAPPPPAPAPERAAGRVASATAEHDSEQAREERERAQTETLTVTGGDRKSEYAPRLKERRGFADLARTPALTAADARRLRQDWRTFADQHPTDTRADEARVRAVEAAALAYRLSGEPTDRQTLDDDVQVYLKRSDAKQQQRARAAQRP